MGELTGLSAIVTGGAQGIGAGIAEVLVQEGARVAITDIQHDRAKQTARALSEVGAHAIALHHDVTSAASCADVVAQVRDSFGTIDVLVNNAGISQRIRFEEIDESAWDRMVNVNLKGVYLMIRATLPEMRRHGSGRIVNIASLLAKTGAPLYAHYAACKFGVVGLTQSLAAELAPDILVNAVAPGSVRTPLWEPELAAVAADKGISVEEAWEAALSQIPLRRPQTPQDIGHVVAFLASDRARNITGETISVNGAELMD